MVWFGLCSLRCAVLLVSCRSRRAKVSHVQVLLINYSTSWKKVILVVENRRNQCDKGRLRELRLEGELDTRSPRYSSYGDATPHICFGLCIRRCNDITQLIHRLPGDLHKAVLEQPKPLDVRDALRASIQLRWHWSPRVPWAAQPSERTQNAEGKSRENRLAFSCACYRSRRCSSWRCGGCQKLHCETMSP